MARSASRQTLERVLRHEFPSAAFEIEEAAGGFLVAVISPELSANADSQLMHKMFERLRDENGRIERPDDRVVVFGLDFKPDAKSLFSEEATLRTQRDRFEGRTLVRTTMLGDAFVLAHHLESEALLIDRGSRASCRVVKNPRWPASPDRLDRLIYLQFDLAGKSFGIRRVDTLPDDVWRVWVD
jgi:hypothetical protein